MLPPPVLDERHLEFLLESTGLAAWSLDPYTGLVSRSSLHDRIFGYERPLQTWTFDTFLAHVLPEYHPQIRAAYEELNASPGGTRIECRIRRVDGAIRWICTQGRLWRGDCGTQRLLGTVEDVTERKLREMRHAFQTELLEATRTLNDPDAVMAVTVERLCRYLDATRCLYAEVEPDEDHHHIAGGYAREGVPVEGRFAFSDFGTVLLESLRAGQGFVVENVAADPRTTAQAERYLAAGIGAFICVPLLKQGKLRATMALHQSAPRNWIDEEVALVSDVVERCWESIERARLDRSLRESDLRFRAIADSIDQMIWSTRSDGFHDYYNRRWYEYTGVPAGSTDGEGWNDMFHPEDQPRAWQIWQHSLETGTPYHIEYRLRHHTGLYRWVLGRAQPLRDDEGQIVRWYGTCTDIQEIVEAREALASSRRELTTLNETLEARVEARTRALEQSNRELQEFSYVASHDLQEPLRKVRTFAGLLLADEGERLSETGRHYARRMQDAAERMSRLVNDLLALSRVTTRGASFRPVDLGDIVAGVISDLSVTIQEARGRVEVEPLPVVEADAVQMQQLFQNLIHNALKYSRSEVPASIHITAETTENFVRISVEDNGIGFEERFADKIFLPFQRLHSRQQYEGTGMGLAIVRRIAERHGGSVDVTSGPGEGSRFTVNLLRKRPQS